MQEQIIYISYIIGQLLHIWLKAGAVVFASNRSASKQEYLEKYRRQIVVRFVGLFALFILFVAVPDAFGVGIGPIMSKLPLMGLFAISLLCGLGMDSLADKALQRVGWEWLRAELPAAPPDPPEV